MKLLKIQLLCLLCLLSFVFYKTTNALATTSNTTPWPNNTVFYIENKTIPIWDKIQSCIDEINKLTNVKMKKIEISPDSPSAYIYFEYKTGGGNYATSIGYANRPIKIHFNADYRTMHELMHVLGFIHEQKRSDRDNHIEIIYENFNQDNSKWNDSEILKKEENSINLTEYDIDSCMQYWCSAGGTKVPWYKRMFTPNYNNEYITMKYKKDPHLKFGTNEHLSPKDILGINTFYKSNRRLRRRKHKKI